MNRYIFDITICTAFGNAQHQQKKGKTKVSEKTIEAAEKTAEKQTEERTLNEQIEKLAGVILENKKRAEECAEKIKTAQQEILKLLNGVIKPVDTPTAYISVRRGATRLDAKKAETIYTVEERPELYKIVPDTAAFKILLTDDEKKEVYTESDPVVTVTAKTAETKEKE